MLDSMSPTAAHKTADEAVFDALYSEWWKAQRACLDPAYDDSKETAERLCNTLSAAEAAFLSARAPTKQQIKHRFHFLNFSIAAGYDREIKAAVASLEDDLRRWGFDLPGAAYA